MNIPNNSFNDISLDRSLLLKATGLVLREERKKLNKSQEQLAIDVNISKTTISNIENGTKSPTIDTWFRLFSQLDLDISKSLQLINLHYNNLKKIRDITSKIE